MNLPRISAKYWINSELLFSENLRGKIVLIDFWDYTCVNCIRTLPYIKEWHKRYHPWGLIVIGVHSPEFPFAKKVENVSRAVKGFGIEYPVVLDNDFAIWRSFGNRYWPAKYLFDTYGRLRYYHFGEGEYEQTERVIQVLLGEVNAEAKFPEPMTPIRDTDKPGAVCYPVTPELYLGYERGRIGNIEDFSLDKPHRFILNEKTRMAPHVFYLDGNFTVLPWAIRYEGGEGLDYGRLLLNYQGFEANLVMHPPQDPVEQALNLSGEAEGRGKVSLSNLGKSALGIVEILQDGKSLFPEIFGEHGRLTDGRSLVEVAVPQMFNLVRNVDVQLRILELRFFTPGIEAYAFTFTSCAQR